MSNQEILKSYAEKNKLIVSHIQSNTRTINIAINIFTIITGFTFSLDVDAEYERIISRVDDRLVITKIEIKQPRNITHVFDPLFDYSAQYEVGQYKINFNLLGNNQMGNTFAVNIPCNTPKFMLFRDEQTGGFINPEPLELQPIILYKKHETQKYTYLGSCYGLNDNMNPDPESYIRIIVTFDGQPTAFTD